MAQADLEVGLVVRGRDLERAGAELLVDGGIGDDRNLCGRPEGAVNFFADPFLYLPTLAHNKR